jgi:ElaB/YqjD/DUF883 family membrane-anchored ribosome-binding protein
MNVETSQNPFPTSVDNTPGLNGGGAATVHKVAEKMHHAVDTLEQKIGAGSEKVMGLQQEYGELAREQVRANPLLALGSAFALGFIFAKLFGGR